MEKGSEKMSIQMASAIIIVGIILLCYMLVKLNQNIRLKAYEFFLKAEHEFISGAGENKMDYVLENVYDYLPTIIRFFISQDMMKSLLQKLFNEIKDLLDDGKSNKSTKEEE